MVCAVEQSFAGPGQGAVEGAVFPGMSPEQIAVAVADACRLHLEAELEDGFLYRVSVGCVFGCRLVDGRRVVIKAYQPRWTPSFLRSVRRVQRHLCEAGLPFTEPLGDVIAVGPAPAVVEAELMDPGPSSRSAGALLVSAAGLARQIEACRRLDEPDLSLHPLRTPTEAVFPNPHSPLFDFQSTADGAEWIESIGERARLRRDSIVSEPVIAHTDWTLRNVRLDEKGLVAVYDADSLAAVPEHVAVGQAAATWSNDDRDQSGVPSPADIYAYIDAYGVGGNLTADEHQGAIAAGVWNLAYIARCEHALDPTGRSVSFTRRWLRCHADAILVAAGAQ